MSHPRSYTVLFHICPFKFLIEIYSARRSRYSCDWDKMGLL